MVGFDATLNLPKTFREQLAASARLGVLQAVAEQRSINGSTVKRLQP